MANTSKEQLARVSMQAYLVSFMYKALIERSQQEVQLLQQELSEIENHAGKFTYAFFPSASAGESLSIMRCKPIVAASTLR